MFAVVCSPSGFLFAPTNCWNRPTLLVSHIALLKQCSLQQTENRVCHMQKLADLFFFANSMQLFPVLYFLVNTFIQTACIFLAPSHVPRYQTFPTALSSLMFELPHTKSTHPRKTTNHRRTPMKSSTAIFVLRNKPYIMWQLYWSQLNNFKWISWGLGFKSVFGISGRWFQNYCQSLPMWSSFWAIWYLNLCNCSYLSILWHKRGAHFVIYETG